MPIAFTTFKADSSISMPWPAFCSAFERSTTTTWKSCFASQKARIEPATLAPQMRILSDGIVGCGRCDAGLGKLFFNCVMLFLAKRSLQAGQGIGWSYL